MKVATSVEFTEQEIRDALLERAKSQVKEQYGKDPIGSSEIVFTQDGADANKPTIGARVNFLANGRVKA